MSKLSRKPAGGQCCGVSPTSYYDSLGPHYSRGFSVNVVVSSYALESTFQDSQQTADTADGTVRNSMLCFFLYIPLIKFPKSDTGRGTTAKMNNRRELL